MEPAGPGRHLMTVPPRWQQVDGSHSPAGSASRWKGNLILFRTTDLKAEAEFGNASARVQLPLLSACPKCDCLGRRRYVARTVSRSASGASSTKGQASSAPADHDHLARLLMLGPGLRPGDVELIEDMRAVWGGPRQAPRLTTVGCGPGCGGDVTAMPQIPGPARECPRRQCRPVTN